MSNRIYQLAIWRYASIKTYMVVQYYLLYLSFISCVAAVGTTVTSEADLPPCIVKTSKIWMLMWRCLCSRNKSILFPWQQISVGKRICWCLYNIYFSSHLCKCYRYCIKCRNLISGKVLKATEVVKTEQGIADIEFRSNGDLTMMWSKECDDITESNLYC